MARGLPDFYRASRLIEGPLFRWMRSGSVEQGDYIYTVAEGKGIVYGGWLNTDKPTAYFGISIDGQEFISERPDVAFTYSLDKEWSSLLYLVQYDEVNSLYTFGLSRGFRFEESLRVLFHAPETFSVYNIRIYYARLV